MSTEHHPLIMHLRSRGESLSSFAKRLNMSRMQLYRIMNGENTTTGRIRLISEATGGAVPMTAFINEDTAQ
ncbi:MAG: helix-turn-helix domain-containing protein [Rhizobiaceae bacterium]|nr:helix-turn-helix domain-containing protein [Rhizobiaceae bacterium]